MEKITLSKEQADTIHNTITALMDAIEMLNAEYYSKSDDILTADKCLKLLDGEIEEQEKKDFNLN